MLGEEAEKLAGQLDITPVMARKLMEKRGKYPHEGHSHTFLDVTKELDSRIIDAMGWLPGGDEIGAGIAPSPTIVPGGNESNPRSTFEGIK